jgi:NAD(P)-dependent dehydrogenase (short-subunit alcohol dehydrogenase family)
MSDRIAIAGASSGIGRSLAERYAAAGHRVFGCGRRKLEQVPFDYQAVDLAVDSQRSAWIQRIEGIETLFDCVGTLPPRKPFLELDPAEIDRTLSINLRARMLLLQGVAKRATINRPLSIVCFASNPAGYPRRELSLYGLGKSAIEFLVACMADENPKTIKIVALYPGMVDTPMLRQSIGKAAGNYPNSADWAHANGAKLLDIDIRWSGKHLNIAELS